MNKVLSGDYSKYGVNAKRAEIIDKAKAFTWAQLGFGILRPEPSIDGDMYHVHLLDEDGLARGHFSLPLAKLPSGVHNDHIAMAIVVAHKKGFDASEYAAAPQPIGTAKTLGPLLTDNHADYSTEVDYYA